MSAKSLAVPALAMIVSFGTVVAISLAADCTHVGVTCPGWGAGSQQAQQTGFCCVGQTSGAVPCGTPIKSVRTAAASCGELRQVQGNNCSATSSGPCGIIQGTTGCTSQPCPG